MSDASSGDLKTGCLKLESSEYYWNYITDSWRTHPNFNTFHLKQKLVNCLPQTVISYSGIQILNAKKSTFYVHYLSGLDTLSNQHVKDNSIKPVPTSTQISLPTYSLKNGRSAPKRNRSLYKSHHKKFVLFLTPSVMLLCPKPRVLLSQIDRPPPPLFVKSFMLTL